MAMFNSFSYVITCHYQRDQRVTIIPGFGDFGQPLAASPLDQSGSLPATVPGAPGRQWAPSSEEGIGGAPMAGSLAILVLLITMVSLSRKKKRYGWYIDSLIVAMKLRSVKRSAIPSSKIWEGPKLWYPAVHVPKRWLEVVLGCVWERKFGVHSAWPAHAIPTQQSHQMVVSQSPRLPESKLRLLTNKRATEHRDISPAKVEVNRDPQPNHHASCWHEQSIMSCSSVGYVKTSNEANDTPRPKPIGYKPWEDWKSHQLSHILINFEVSAFKRFNMWSYLQLVVGIFTDRRAEAPWTREESGQKNCWVLKRGPKNCSKLADWSSLIIA